MGEGIAGAATRRTALGRALGTTLSTLARANLAQPHPGAWREHCHYVTACHATSGAPVGPNAPLHRRVQRTVNAVGPLYTLSADVPLIIMPGCVPLPRTALRVCCHGEHHHAADPTGRWNAPLAALLTTSLINADQLACVCPVPVQHAQDQDACGTGSRQLQPTMSITDRIP